MKFQKAERRQDNFLGRQATFFVEFPIVVTFKSLLSGYISIYTSHVSFEFNG